MDLGTTIIGAVIVLLCALPLIIMHSNKKKKEQKIINALNDFALSNSFKISEYDIWLNTAIGIDRENRVLFFLKGTEKNRTIKMVNLADIRDVSKLPLDSIDRPRNIEHLELALHPKLKEKPAIFLEFYNSNVSMQLTDELILLKKWDRIVSDTIQH